MIDGGIHVTPSPRSFERRMDYLDRVGEHLQMPDDRRDDLLDEIGTHLDDTIVALMDEGLSIAQAEREAMARLGSPEELGDNLRRTHQTTKRLLAAAGGGVWRGLEGAITGWIMAGLISMPIAWIVLALATVIETLLPRLGIDTDGLMISLSPAITCGAMWLAGRWMVRSIAAASWRRAHLVRRQVAAIGFAVMGVAVLMLPADFTWLGVILSIGIPFAFAAGAMSAGGRDDGRPWVAVRWPSRFPSRRKVLWGSVIGLVVAIAFGAVAGVMGMNDSWTDGEASAPPQDPWTVGGYAAVAPARAEQDLGLAGSAMPREGWVMVNLPTDAVDWDRWTGLRVEAWRATSPYSGSGVQALVDPERGPYLVVPMADPWSQPKVAVRVGQPGIGGFVLFVVAQDPATGARVVIGSPEGEQTTFHGSLIDWFAAL